MNKGNRYCLLLLSWTGLCLGLLATFNSTIDPYQLLGTAQVHGLNAKKTEIFYMLGVTKSYQFYTSDASSLILGSSRGGRAIDPTHPTLDGQHYYNFATPGSFPRLDYLKLKSAVETREIKRVIYCVDFFTFNEFYVMPTSVTDSFANRMSLDGPFWASPAFVQQALLDYGANFWAYYSIRDSIQTLRKQDAAESGKISYTTLNNDGLWNLSFAKNRRQLEAFIGMEDTYIRDTWFTKRWPYFSLNQSEVAINQSFDDFSALLSLAHDHQVELTLVILPVHARLLENIYYAGLWENFEYWKKQMVAVNTDIASAGGFSPFMLWDFNGYYPPIATEPVSDNVNAAPLKWVYDSAHAHINTGNRILDIISANAEPDFGGKIDATNIDSWLETQRNLREAFQTANPQTVKSIKRRVSRFRKRQPWKVSPPPARTGSI